MDLDKKYIDRVQFELIRQTYKQNPTLALSSVISNFVISFIFWGKVPDIHIFIWLSSLFISAVLLTTVVIYFYNKIKPDMSSIHYWGKIVVLLMCVRTTAMGSAGYLLYVPDSMIYQIFLVATILVAVVYMGMAITYIPAYKYPALLLVAPLLFSLFVFGQDEQMLIGLLVILSVGVAFSFYNKIISSIERSLYLQFEKEQLTIDLDKKIRQAENMNLAKSQFFAAASHDLRQPLHAQGLYIAELKQIVKDDKAIHILNGLDKSIDAMQMLFNTLLDISKLDAGAVKSHIQDIPINQLFNELNNDYAGSALDRNLGFRIVQSRLIVKSDAILLSQILRNMVSNAIRYTDKGGVLIGCRRKSDMVKIEVWDTGCGIAPDNRESIFEEFHQLSNPSRDREKGLGLGLAIVKRLSILLNHSLRLNSRVGKGSTFIITVPVGSSLTYAESGEELNMQSCDVLSNSNVLVIDDE